MQLAEPLTSSSVGNWTSNRVVGDWNRDGALDVAVVNYDLSSVSVVLGKPDGTFRPRTDYPTGMNPAAIAAHDLNADGAVDLVIVNSGSASATVLLGKGDGTFGARADYATVGSAPGVVAIADWSGDGRPDFIAGDTLFIGKADGTFARGITYGYVPNTLAAADLDRDGKQDLLLMQGADAYVLLARGDGTFLRKWALEVDNAFQPTLGDLNGDGVPDLTIVGFCADRSNSAFYLMMGLGDGTFRVTQILTEASNAEPCGLPVGIGDVNGDGKADLQFGVEKTWFGNGDGTFVPFEPGSPNTADQLLSLADWNEDGRLDVAVVDTSGVLKSLPGDGTGRFHSLTSYPVPVTAGYLAFELLVDFNLDGHLDLALLSDHGVDILQGNGDGTFVAGPAHHVASTPFSSWGDLIVADVNGDGVPDLIYADGTVNVLVSADRNFGFEPAPGSAGAGKLGAVGDMDGDGKLDLILLDGVPSDQSAVLTTLFGSGDGTFGRPVQTPLETNVFSAVLADLDNDGRLDAVVASQSSEPPQTMRRFKGNPDGSFTAQDEITLGLPLWTGPIAAGDMNGDGNQDVVVADGAGDTIAVYLGVGGGALGTPLEYSPTHAFGWNPPVGKVLVDVNGDGALDLVSAYGNVLLGAGDGTFACDEVAMSDFNGYLAFGDMNQDGKLDAVPVSDTTNGTVATVLLAH